MGFVDIPGVSDNDICVTKYNLRNMIVTPNSKDEHSIYFDIDYDIQAEIFEERNVKIVKDLYSVKDEVSFNTKSVKIMKQKQAFLQKFQIRSSIKIDDLNSIYSTNLKAVIINKKIYDNKLNIEGELELELLYETNLNNNMNSRTVKIPFNQIMDWNSDNANIYISIQEDNYIIKGDGNIDCIIDCECDTQDNNEITLDLINEFTIMPCDNKTYYSMVIYFVKPTDTLWSIAKQFKSTIEDIKYVNGIDDNSCLKAGDKLYITKGK